MEQPANNVKVTSAAAVRALFTVTEIWIDRETGVHYLFHRDGYAGGLTPLLDREGKPIVSSVYNR